MKKETLLLIATLLTPSVTFADAADFDEIDYVFRSFESETPAVLQDCVDIDVPFVPNGFGNFDLYSLHSKKTNGKVLKDKIKKIGHVLTCVDASEIGPENPFGLFPAYFKVSIDGMELIVSGQGRFVSFDVPESPVGLSSFALQIVEGPPEIVGGMLVTNTISNVFGVPGYIDGSFATVRIFTSAVGNVYPSRKERPRR